MYHVKRDKRSQRSAENILLTFQRLLDSRALSEISASDIIREAEVSRSTFYRLFDTPEDVLLYWCSEFEFVLEQQFSNICFDDLKHFFVYTFQFFINHSKLPAMLVQNNRQDILRDIYFKRIVYLNQPNFLPVIPDPVKRMYFSELIYNSIFTLITVWLQGDQKEEIHDLYEYIKEYHTMMSKGLIP